MIQGMVVVFIAVVETGAMEALEVAVVVLAVATAATMERTEVQMVAIEDSDAVSTNYSLLVLLRCQIFHDQRNIAIITTSGALLHLIDRNVVLKH